MNPARLDAILRHMSGPVLDVGCGSGAYVLDPRVQMIKGCDVNRFVDWATRPNSFVQASALQLPYRDRSFDMVTCFETLEHLECPAEAVAELARVSRRSVIVTVPNCQQSLGMAASNLAFGHYTDTTHRQFFDLTTIGETLRLAGLTIVEANLINAINPWPFIAESLHLPQLVARVGRRLVRSREIHRMTCLVVAEVRSRPEDPSRSDA